MATTDVVSIDKPVGAQKYADANNIIEEVRTALDQLDKLLVNLTQPAPEGAQWSGVECERFMNAYMDMRTQITTNFPNTLNDVTTNLDANLKKLVQADGGS